MNRRYLVGAIICLGAMTVAAVPAVAATWSKNSDDSAAVCFDYSKLDADAQQAAVKAAANWSAASTALTVKAGNCGSGDHVVNMTNTSLEGTTLGQTRWGSSGENFVYANIVYDNQGVSSWGGAKAWDMVVCHEIGHALGLPHSKDPNSCMQTGLRTPVTEPAQSDFKQLLEMYGGSPGQATSAMAASNTNQQTGQSQDLPNNQANLPRRTVAQIGNGTCNCPDCCPAGAVSPAAPSQNGVGTNQPTTIPAGNVATSSNGSLVAPWTQNRSVPTQPNAVTGQRVVAQQVPTTNTQVVAGNAGQVSTASFDIDHPPDDNAMAMAARWRTLLK